MTDSIATVQEKPVGQRQILMAVAHSEASIRGCQWAVDNLLRPGDVFHLFHVVEMPLMDIIVGADNMPVTYIDPVADRKNVLDAEQFISTDFVPLLKGFTHKVEVVHFQTSAQAVGEAICQRAKELRAAAVVMASSNKHGIQLMFLGSTCSHCTSHCTQTVVVVR